jgi:hypothetical protein
MATVTVKKKRVTGGADYHATGDDAQGLIEKSAKANTKVEIMKKANAMLKNPKVVKVKVWHFGPRGGLSCIKTLKPKRGRMMTSGGKLTRGRICR